MDFDNIFLLIFEFVCLIITQRYKNMNIYESWLVKKQIAHRGLHDRVSEENSLSAFEKAIQAGYAIEMDVQMTSDGTLVVFHDNNLKRMTGVAGDIRETKYEHIKDLKLGNSDEKIPTFDEFLNFIDGRTPLLIEVKTHANVGLAEQKIIDRLLKYKGEFALQSFNPFIVKYFAEHAPQFVRGQLASDFKNDTMPFYQKILLKNLFFIKSNKSQFVSYDVEAIRRPLIKRIKKRMPVIMWTVRKQSQIDELKEYYDNIIFENFIPAK